MLRMLKKQMRGILIATILLIIPSFILFYGARQTGRSPDRARHAGEVYGRNISHEEYRQALQWTQISARMRYGEQFEDIKQFLNLESEAWQNIVLYEAAQRRGVAVTDGELLSFITSLPMFASEDGEFDPRLYHNILSYALGLRPEQFESYMRRALAVSRLREKVTDGIRATESEVKNFYSYLNEETMAAYVEFPAEEFTSEAEISEQMLEEYFQNNREEFRQPEMREIEYIAFEPDPGRFEARQNEIESYYRRNIEDFTSRPDNEEEPEIQPLEDVRDEIKERIITGKASARAREGAEELILDIEEGFTFWEDLERGNTGYVSSGSAALPRALIRRAFDSDPGRTAGPLKANEKHYIFKVTGRNPSYIPSSHEIVRGEAKELARREEAGRIAEAKALEFLDSAREKSSLESAAEEADRVIHRTEYFTRRGRIPEMGAAPEFAAKAFSLSEDAPLAASPVPSGYAVMEFIEKKPVDMEEFQEEKERFRQYVESDKSEKIFSDWFNLILSESEAKFYLEADSPPAAF